MDKSDPICRVCMQQSSEFVNFDMPLQNENEEDTIISYLDFFYECTRIEVEPHEVGSQCFCLPCGDELRSFYKFMKIAEMTDQILKSNHLLKGKNIPIPKTDPAFEIIAWEPEAENDFIPELEYLNENVEEKPIDNKNGSQQYKDVDANGKFENQLLVDLRVEIFHDNKSPVNNSLDNLLDSCYDNKEDEIAHAKDLLNKKTQRSKVYEKGPFECAFCHEILKNRKRLDNHLVEEHHRRTQPCVICGKMVIRMRDHLLIHYREKNDISRPKTECPICLRKISKQTISRHIRYVHKREVRKIKCPQCFQTFADAHKLKVHLTKGHTSDRNIKCPLCCRIFSHGVSLNNHLRTHPCLDRISQKQAFSCDKCPLFFIAKKLLVQHRKVHTYSCEI